MWHAPAGNVLCHSENEPEQGQRCCVVCLRLVLKPACVTHEENRQEEPV